MARGLLTVVAILFGCGEGAQVSVHCVTTAAPAVECDVTQTKGKAEVEACWDFEARCENGAVVKAARTCQKVKGGGTVRAIIAADELEGVDACAGSSPPTATLSNLTLDGRK
jgi:hypothetical protein